MNEAGVMEFTGERMVPEGAPASVFWEHIYRYRFATRFVAGKSVLDVACGEGYGAAGLLAAGATHVIGVDVSAESCAQARGRYGVEAREARAESLPLSNNSIEVVVSFETIEHLPNPRLFLVECQRVLVSGGILIMSTPNRAAHDTDYRNPFHCSEMEEPCFLHLLSTYFDVLAVYGQGLKTHRWFSTATLWASSAPWHSLRAANGILHFIQKVAGGTYVGEPTARVRNCAAELVVGHDGRLDAALNPYKVYPRTSHIEDIPSYIIAVVSRRHD